VLNYLKEAGRRKKSAIDVAKAGKTWTWNGRGDIICTASRYRNKIKGAAPQEKEAGSKDL